MIPPRPPTPPHLKRYGWYRVYNDFTRHPKWRAISTLLDLPLHEILAVAMEVMRAANVGRPRGSLSEFSFIECAAALDLPAEHVARIYVAMEDHGWIDQDYLVTWDERQPDKEDPTNKERQRRFRQRRKEERESARNGVTPALENPRNAVTSVTSRPDQTRSRSAGDNVQAVEWEESAEKWLAGQGLEIVRRCGKLLMAQAAIRVTRWRNDMRNDEALRNLIHASAALAADGKFLNLVGEGVARHVRERAAGAQLPMGPVRLKAADK